MSSDGTLSSGIFYNALECRAVFTTYRRLESTLSKSLVQATTSHQYLLQNLKASGYLPPQYAHGVPDPPHLRPTTFISIELKKQEAEARYREGLASGRMGQVGWSPASSRSQGRRMSFGSSVRSASRGR